MSDIDFSRERPPRAGRSSPVLQWVVMSVCFAGSVALGWFGYMALRAEKQDGDSARERLERVEAQLAAAAERVEKLSAENEELVRERDNLTAEVAAKDGELSKLRATFDDLEDKMKEEIAKGEIHVSQAGGRVEVDLVDKILFPSGEAALSERGQEVLSRIGKALGSVEDKQIQVSGHTDDSPPSERLEKTFPTNWELSAARAVNVVRFLAEKGVPSKRMVAAGHGEFQPIASNATEKGRARNRRIEILLTPALDKKPMVAEKAAPAKAKAEPAKKPARRAMKKALRKTASAQR